VHKSGESSTTPTAEQLAAPGNDTINKMLSDRHSHNFGSPKDISDYCRTKCMRENIGACGGTQEEQPGSISACTVELEKRISLHGKMLENISVNVKGLDLLNVLTPAVASLQKSLDTIMARESDANQTMEKPITMVSMEKDNKENHNSNATMQQKQHDNMHPDVHQLNTKLQGIENICNEHTKVLNELLLKDGNILHSLLPVLEDIQKLQKQSLEKQENQCLEQAPRHHTEKILDTVGYIKEVWEAQNDREKSSSPLADNNVMFKALKNNVVFQTSTTKYLNGFGHVRS